MFITYSADNKESAMMVDQAPKADDRLVDRDVETACGQRWLSPVVSNPFTDTAERFEQDRVQHEQRGFRRY